jgi:hypothetical protein
MGRFVLACFGALFGAAASQPFDAQWTATDSLGRSLPSAAEVGAPRGKIVGVFYWLWQGFIRTNPIRDVSTEMANHPNDPQFAFQDWFHGLPEVGYYHSGDPWVARRHLQMLANAGIDFIFFDWTNGPIPNDPQILYSFLNVAEDMLSKGIPVPKFCFFLNAAADTTFDWIMANVYTPEKYSQLWMLFDGKPLLLSGDPLTGRQDELQRFTLRPTWAFGEQTEDYWRFIDTYPQRPSTHGGVVEQICVGKAMGAPALPPGAVNDKGATFHNGQTPPYNEAWISPDTPKGLYFEEQWQHAIQVDPPVVTVTGWNEWTSGAWYPDDGMVGSWTFLGKVMTESSYRFVDEFNAEFNRDIEPMTGGYSDAYYYQLVSHVRQFKGLPASTPASPAQTVRIDGDFSEWQAVLPVYRDPEGDTVSRSFQNTDGSATLTDSWGRNDIVESRMVHDADHVYVYAKVAGALTSPSPGSWMSLYLDVDASSSTGWMGFDFATQYAGTPGQQVLMKYVGDNCQFKDGTDCVGDDLKRIDVAFDAYQCCDLCKAEDGCTHWSWDRDSTMACYLKSACSNPISAGSVSGERGGNEFSAMGTAVFAYKDSELEIALPKSILGIGELPRINFKWRDNSGHMSSIHEMLVSSAEAAPDRRFSFPYVADSTANMLVV